MRNLPASVLSLRLVLSLEDKVTFIAFLKENPAMSVTVEHFLNLLLYLSFLPFPHNGSVNQTISDYGNFSSASLTISYYSILLNGAVSEELHRLRLISCGRFHMNY